MKARDRGSRSAKRQIPHLTSDKGLASDRASSLHNGSPAVGGHLRESAIDGVATPIHTAVEAEL